VSRCNGGHRLLAGLDEVPGAEDRAVRSQP
jgi:hypothetical protein